MTAHPLPAAALDDRLGYFGTAGSGKTYNAGSGVERMLHDGKRVIIPDPLGVWWGLRLRSDGKSKGFDIIIIGGPHGDLPLTEHVGALIGETVAGMKESVILDLSELGTKAAERRFMLAFLTALYKHANGEPVHVVFDEADMWAPQKLLDKEGHAAQLLGMMETIVRRGRVKGFIPWLISQRPAVLSKDVLSQVDGLVAFKLTSSQDRDALGDWVKGQADIGQWNDIWKSLPTLERGQGVVWLPARGTLKTAAFPEKVTFDSSRTPKRGEKAHAARKLKPVNLDRLRDRMATVEAETKANDPRALKAEITRLTKAVADAEKAKPAKPDATALTARQEKAITRATITAKIEGYADAMQAIRATMASVRGKITPLAQQLADLQIEVAKIEKWSEREQKKPTAMSPVTRDDVARAIQQSEPAAPAAAARPVRMAGVTPKRLPAGGNGTLTGPQQRIVDAIRWWNVLGIAVPSHPQVGFIAGYSHKSGTWSTYLGQLRSAGMIEPRDLVLTEAGLAAANDPDAPPTGEQLRATVMAKLDGPLQRIMGPIIEAYPNALSHPEAGERAGYSHASGTWSTYLGRARSLDLLDGRGELRAQAWLFP